MSGKTRRCKSKKKRRKQREREIKEVGKGDR